MKDEVKISRANAIKAFKSADAKGKQLLSDLIGKDVLNPDIKEIIKTFEDACAYNGVDPEDILPYSDPSDADEIAINAFAKLTQISKALNEGVKMDFSNSSQPKWRAWFEYKSGLGLSYHGYDHWRTDTHVGSRLSYATRELAVYAGNQFIKEYREMMS